MINSHNVGATCLGFQTLRIHHTFRLHPKLALGSQKAHARHVTRWRSSPPSLAFPAEKHDHPTMLPSSQTPEHSKSSNRSSEERKRRQQDNTGDPRRESFCSGKMSFPFRPRAPPAQAHPCPQQQSRQVIRGVPAPAHLISAQLLHRLPLNGERRSREVLLFSRPGGSEGCGRFLPEAVRSPEWGRFQNCIVRG